MSPLSPGGSSANFKKTRKYSTLSPDKFNVVILTSELNLMEEVEPQDIIHSIKSQYLTENNSGMVLAPIASSPLIDVIISVRKAVDSVATGGNTNNKSKWNEENKMQQFVVETLATASDDVESSWNDVDPNLVASIGKSLRRAFKLSELVKIIDETNILFEGSNNDGSLAICAVLLQNQPSKHKVRPAKKSSTMHYDEAATRIFSKTMLFLF